MGWNNFTAWIQRRARGAERDGCGLRRARGTTSLAILLLCAGVIGLALVLLSPGGAPARVRSAPAMFPSDAWIRAR